MDLLPTFVSMGGGKIEPKRKLDGIDVTKALEGAATARKPLFWKHGGSLAVRDGDWKLVVTVGKKKKQFLLFNLAKDRNETNNLSTKYPEVMGRLTLLVEQWVKDVTVESPVSQ
jgi:arylsulfatase A-like enzyme